MHSKQSRRISRTAIVANIFAIEFMNELIRIHVSTCISFIHRIDSSIAAWDKQQCARKKRYTFYLRITSHLFSCINISLYRFPSCRVFIVTNVLHKLAPIPHRPTCSTYEPYYRSPYEPSAICHIELSSELVWRPFAAIVLRRTKSTSVGCHLISFPLRRQIIDKKNEVQCENFQYFIN